MKFNNKRIIVTGGSNGIGLAAVNAFTNEGGRVAILDIESPEPTSVSRPDLAEYFHTDVADPNSIQSAFRQLGKTWDAVDVLINNAGIQHYGTVAETDLAEWDHVMHVNLRSAFLCSKHALPFMQKSEKGVIVNVASVQAFISQERVAAYTTSKTALLGLTRSIAVDYGPEIRCVAVCPGTVDTPMLRNALAEMDDPKAVLQECNAMHLTGRIAKAEEVAELILYLSGDSAGFITGQAFRIDGGLGIKIGGN